VYIRTSLACKSTDHMYTPRKNITCIHHKNTTCIRHARTSHVYTTRTSHVYATQEHHMYTPQEHHMYTPRKNITCIHHKNTIWYDHNALQRRKNNILKLHVILKNITCIHHKNITFIHRKNTSMFPNFFANTHEHRIFAALHRWRPQSAAVLHQHH